MAVNRRLSARNMATETNRPFEGPPSPPSSKSSEMWRIVAAGGGIALISYIFMLPENDYGISEMTGGPLPPSDTSSDALDEKAR